MGLVLFGHRFCLPQSLMASDQEELYIEQHQWKLFEHFYLPFYNEEYCLMKYENATVCYDDESLKKQADQKYLEFIIQLEKLGVADAIGTTYEESRSEGSVMLWMNLLNMAVLS